jgi:hypothetical protein
MQIVALCGLPGAGKDTFADVLVRQYGFTRVSFASKLKDVVAIVFGWDRELLEGRSAGSREWREQEDRWWAQRLNMPGLTPRRVLQAIGTDVFRRHWHDEIWLAAAEREMATLSAGRRGIVVTDCRFPNEFDMLRSMGARVVCMRRGAWPEWVSSLREGRISPNDMASEPGAPAHSSDWLWATERDIAVVDNDGPPEALVQAAEVLVGAPPAYSI